MQEVKAIDLKEGDELSSKLLGCRFTVLKVCDGSIIIKRENDGRSFKVSNVRIDSDLTKGYLSLLGESKAPKLNDNTIPVTTNACNHKNTFKNHAGGQYFLQCRTCKADLGNI